MKRILLAISALVCLLAHAIDYGETQAKANRFFTHGEWASASAMYNFMLKERPEEPDTYGRAVVSNAMMGDSLRTMQLLSDAMRYGVPLDSVLARVRMHSYQIGEPALYEHFMLSAAAHNPWMSRAIDAKLLQYYSFRRNGPKMEEYACKMLEGAPDNASFLEALAQGCMLQGNSRGALEAWGMILEHDPDNYQALLETANCLYLLDRRQDALPYYRRAMELRATPYVAQRIQELEGKKH